MVETKGEIIMKRKNCRALLLTALVAAGALLLTACTQSESTSTQNSGNQSTAEEGSAQNVSGTTVSDSTQNTAGMQTSDAAQNAGTADSTQNSSAEQSVSTSDEPVGDVIPDEYADAAEAENQADDVWSGTYVSESESVSVTLINDETISFSFAQSGISGNASVNGSQAVFNGDDYHVVVFSLNDTVLNIAVSSEEDFDASSSPLNGTYIRSAD